MDETIADSNKQKVRSPKKRKDLSLGHLSLIEKNAIINLYNKYLDDQPTMKKVEVVRKITMTMGVARSTVYRTIKEYKSTGEIRNSIQSGGRPGIVASFDETVKDSLRRIVYSFFLKNEIPTLDKILAKVKSRQDLPEISRSSLHKLLKLMNFKYFKRGKSVLIERGAIVK